MKNALDRKITDTRTAVLVTILMTLGVLPHSLNIVLPVMAMYMIMAVWRLMAFRYRWIPVSKWIVILFAVIGFSVSAWHYGPPIGRDPGVSFLIIVVPLSRNHEGCPKDQDTCRDGPAKMVMDQHQKATNEGLSGWMDGAMGQVLFVGGMEDLPLGIDIEESNDLVLPVLAHQ